MEGANINIYEVKVFKREKNEKKLYNRFKRERKKLLACLFI